MQGGGVGQALAPPCSRGAPCTNMAGKHTAAHHNRVIASIVRGTERHSRSRCSEPLSRNAYRMSSGWLSIRLQFELDLGRYYSTQDPALSSPNAVIPLVF